MSDTTTHHKCTRLLSGKKLIQLHTTFTSDSLAEQWRYILNHNALKLKIFDTNNVPHKNSTYSNSHLILTCCFFRNTIKVFNSDYTATRKLPIYKRYNNNIAKQINALTLPDPQHTNSIAHTHTFKNLRTAIFSLQSHMFSTCCTHVRYNNVNNS